MESAFGYIFLVQNAPSHSKMDASMHFALENSASFKRPYILLIDLKVLITAEYVRVLRGSGF